MREWFIVGAKLLGIYFLYWSLTSILTTMTYLLSLLSASSWKSTEPFNTSVALNSLVTFGIMIVFSFLLLFKTHRIADRLNLVEDMPRSPESPRRPNLQLGLVLIGTYIFFSHIGNLVKVILLRTMLENAYSPIAATQPKGVSWSRDLIDPSITILFSLILIFGAKQLAGFLARAETDKI